MGIHRFLLFVGLIALSARPVAAQTQLDEGKTAPQLFASVCSACHKSPRGLAKETNASTLASFLRAHYTTGREQAGVLAAYVLQAGPAPEPRTPPPAASKPAEEPPRPPRPTGQAQTEPPANGDAKRGARAEDRSTVRAGSRARSAAPAAAPEPKPPVAASAAATPAVTGRTDDIAD
jgi:hypothetical protein